MIIIVHCIGIIIFQILRNRKRLKTNCNTFKTPSQEADEQILKSKFKFDPPLYRQRYLKVYETLIQEKWRNSLKKLVDFGCAEYGLFHYIKNLNLEEILFVDIDECVLYEKNGLLEPLLSDRLGRRRAPLEIKVFRGSAIDPDYRLQKTDVVTALELIEHLYPDTLDALPYNIFFFIRPKLAVFTTPNIDFNVVFEKSSAFRHPDHKFEWTSEQFFDWGTNITQRFPDYSVEFHGIGEGPSNYKNIGCCSQAAIFIRKDMLHESYISSVDVKFCQCDNSSPCKGPIVECKLLCNCLCTYCLPDISVGVCNYLSCNLTETDAYRPMKSFPRASHSAKNFNSFWDFTTRAFPALKEEDIDKSNNIFYKLLMNIDYPYMPDTRSDTQILMDTFEYRINLFSHVNSRFYVNEKDQCEIPVKEIVHGGIDVTLEEVRHLLCDAGYRVEKCVIPEIDESEWCIVSVPQEMDDTTSDSEVTDGYSPRSSECNEDPRLEANIQPVSDWYKDLDVDRNDKPISNWENDWDNASYLTQESKVESHQEATSSSATSKNPIPDPLFDSGYLKSPSPLETNKRLPNLLQFENTETCETDIFEDSAITPSLSNDDNNLHIKKTGAKEKCPSALVPLLENHNRPITLDSNRLNELDRFRNVNATKTSTNNHLKPQNEFKKSPFKDLSPVAGTSGGWSKYRKCSKDKKGQEKKEPSEPSPFDDFKSVTNCIQDSLNKIELKGDEIGQSELIKDLSPLQEVFDVVDAGLIELPLEPEHQQQEPPQQAVENGDLVNNNRDNEGNNMPVNDAVDLDIDEGIDLLNDNLEDLVPLLADNVNIMENNNDAVEEIRNEPVEVEEYLRPPHGAVAIDDEIEDSSVANREVFYDENLEQELLVDFELPPHSNQDNLFTLSLDAQVALVGVRSTCSDSATSGVDIAGCVAHSNRNNFPNWLLQMLRTAAMPQNANVQPPTRHDEPHFYCQGDGLGTPHRKDIKEATCFSNAVSLGVHPSVIALEVDEAEDADIDSTTEETLSNNTVDYAEANPGPSDTFDASILPERSALAIPMIEKDLSKCVECSEKATAEGEEIATNGIAPMDAEACRRYQVDLQEESSQRNRCTAELPHAVINDRCSLETSPPSEYPSLIFASAESSEIDEHSFLQESRNQENSATLEGELSGEIFEQANSFNDSEKSHYDSTKEF